MIEIEKEDLEQDAQGIRHTLHLLVCAKQWKAVEQERGELELIRQKLLISRQKEEDLEPERKCLGYTLRRYYEGLLEENARKRKANEEEAAAIASELSGVEGKLSELSDLLIENAARSGGLRSAAASYDRSEDEYNQRYGEEFIRNILGVYEPGTLEIRREDYEKELEGGKRSRLALLKQQEQANEQSRSLERGLEDMRAELLKGKMDL